MSGWEGVGGFLGEGISHHRAVNHHGANFAKQLGSSPGGLRIGKLHGNSSSSP